MKKYDGYEYALVNPKWIDKKKKMECYYDDDFFRILLFFVINTPCADVSYRSKDLEQYGWDKNVWKKSHLKNRLLKVTELERGRTFIVADKIDEMKKICEIAGTKNNFYQYWNNEKIVIYNSRKNEFLSVFHHIRNSLAHGRFEIYEDKLGSITYVMEDGVRTKNKFEVRARMILKKQTLINWIDILERKS